MSPKNNFFRSFEHQSNHRKRGCKVRGGLGQRQYSNTGNPNKKKNRNCKKLLKIDIDDNFYHNLLQTCIALIFQELRKCLFLYPIF